MLAGNLSRVPDAGPDRRIGPSTAGCHTCALGFPDVLKDVLDTLDATAVRNWSTVGLERLRGHQHEIDELNVYPVPDGDTGTNLVLTLAAAQEALERFLAEHPETATSTGPGEAGPSGDGDATVTSSGDAHATGTPSGEAIATREAGASEVSEAGRATAAGEATTTPLGRAMRRMARGALLGARGNSGVIVSQILRGMADTFATSVAVLGGELARA